MFGLAKTAVKYFAYGLAIGLLFAPQSGARTRQFLVDRFGDYWRDLMGAGTEATRRAAEGVEKMAEQVEEKTYHQETERGTEFH